MVRWGQERSRDALDRAERAIAAARAVDEREALAQALIVADLADFALHGPNAGRRLREALDIFSSSGTFPTRRRRWGTSGGWRPTPPDGTRRSTGSLGADGVRPLR